MSDPLAQVFGRTAEDYDRGRPDWPGEALDLVTLELSLRASAEVVDLAAGTGKLTRILAERFARVVAIEPDDAMRALISGADVLAGTAEDIPMPDDSADAVFCGEAFHWFDGAVALAEIARVLRPGGRAVILDMRHTGQYAEVFRAAGCAQVEHRRPPTLPLVAALTWGSVRPGTVVARK